MGGNRPIVIPMTALKITSIQSEIADYSCQLITQYITKQLQMPIAFMDQLPWQDREQLFDRGEIQVCWMCSLPYIWRVDQNPHAVELLAAPVMQPLRYQNQPVYFSDVVVNSQSTFRTFDDLRGASWAYNEPQSHSGYNITRYQLALMGFTNSFFGQVIGSGSHIRSLEMLLANQIDASAIDTTVLDLLLTKKPEFGEQIRVVDTWGPSPIPPWVVSKNLDRELRQTLRKLLLEMHRDPEGRKILDQGLIDHFTQVDDQFYDSVREMYRTAATVKL